MNRFNVHLLIFRWLLGELEEELFQLVVMELFLLLLYFLSCKTVDSASSRLSFEDVRSDGFVWGQS